MNEERVIEAAKQYAQAVRWLHKATDEYTTLKERLDALNHRIKVLRDNVYQANDELNGWVLGEYDE